jgi:hypothetical protein
MTVMKTLRAFMRGCFSALELFPTSSRRATRDAMVDAQAMSVGTVWMQVGELLREAQGEFSGKKARLIPGWSKAVGLPCLTNLTGLP